MMVELLLILPVLTLMYVYLLESWKFVYQQHQINNLANFTINYWAKNDAPDCSDVESWLVSDVMTPIANANNLDLNQISISTTYPNLCNCAGSKLELTLTSSSTLFKYFTNPTTYSVAIKEGDLGENC